VLDLCRNAAGHEVSQSWAAVLADDDQVTPYLVGDAEDFRGRVALPQPLRADSLGNRRPNPVEAVRTR
jgi:hypothetical protein